MIIDHEPRFIPGFRPLAPIEDIDETPFQRSMRLGDFGGYTNLPPVWMQNVPDISAPIQHAFPPPSTERVFPVKVFKHLSHIHPNQ